MNELTPTYSNQPEIKQKPNPIYTPTRSQRIKGKVRRKRNKR